MPRESEDSELCGVAVIIQAERDGKATETETAITRVGTVSVGERREGEGSDEGEPGSWFS